MPRHQKYVKIQMLVHLRYWRAVKTGASHPGRGAPSLLSTVWSLMLLSVGCCVRIALIAAWWNLGSCCHQFLNMQYFIWHWTTLAVTCSLSIYHQSPPLQRYAASCLPNVIVFRDCFSLFLSTFLPTATCFSWSFSSHGPSLLTSWKQWVFWPGKWFTDQIMFSKRN